MKNNSYRKYTDLAKTLELNIHSECIAKVKFLEVKQTLIKPAYSMEGNCKPSLPASPAPAVLSPQKGKHSNQRLPVCTDPGALRPQEMFSPRDWLAGARRRPSPLTSDSVGPAGKQGGRARAPGWSSRGYLSRPKER